MKKTRSLGQYYRNEPFIHYSKDIIDIPDDPDTTSWWSWYYFVIDKKVTGQTGNNGRKDV